MSNPEGFQPKRILGERKKEEPPRGEAERNFRVIQGGLARHEKRTPIVTIGDAKIEEEKTFTKEEVLKIIEQVAEAEGFKKEDLETEKEYYDKNGNLIKLYIQVKPGKTKGIGWDNIFYTYMIKGRHGEIGGGIVTLISRVFKRGQGKGEVLKAGIVAEYKNGQWKLSPGNILPEAGKVTPME
ncbi:MAG: hypothetical protein HYW90_04085 [Candidatus Sungbacteria bacterium]|nr:hypothetical protein [Candidatus Sungbacteria bacterium]